MPSSLGVFVALVMAKFGACGVRLVVVVGAALFEI